MTHSERIAAVRDGLETEAEQRTVLNEGLAAFFAKGEDDRQLGFGIQVEVFQRWLMSGLRPFSEAGD